MMATCEKHGEYASEICECPAIESTTGLGILRPAYSFETACPQCAEEFEAKMIARDKAAEEKERQDKIAEIERRRLYALKSMNIEPSFYEVRLENFIADTTELEHNLARVRDLIEGRIQKAVMIGKNGTGKTHLACSALHVLGGRIMTMYEISTTIRASYTPMANKTELDIVDELARLPLLVIDEIGRTKGGDAEQNWLSYLIDKRHNRGLPLILISNKHTRKTCEVNGCADCLENYIGEDIMSRLTQGGALLKFSGEDYRKRKD